jgi:cytochrome c553
MCAGCHGIDMYRTAFPEVYSVPKLGGQHAAYIAKALQEYKAGNRSHPSMRAIAASLTEQDMADLAAYFGTTTAAK